MQNPAPRLLLQVKFYWNASPLANMAEWSIWDRDLNSYHLDLYRKSLLSAASAQECWPLSTVTYLRDLRLLCPESQHVHPCETSSVLNTWKGSLFLLDAPTKYRASALALGFFDTSFSVMTL